MDVPHARQEWARLSAYVTGLAVRSVDHRSSPVATPAANQLRRRLRHALGIPGSVHFLDALSSRLLLGLAVRY